MAGQILLIARLLADEHHEGVARAFAENGLCRVAVQVAAVAVCSGGAKLRKRETRGKEIAGRAGEVARWGRGRSCHRASGRDDVRFSVRWVSWMRGKCGSRIDTNLHESPRTNSKRLVMIRVNSCRFVILFRGSHETEN